MAEEFSKHESEVNYDTVDPDELADIVREACGARNGWKVVLARCSPEKRSAKRVVALAGISE